MRARLHKFILTLLLASIGPGLAATISAQIDPPSVNAGETSTLTLSVGDGEVDKVDLPRIDGVLVQPGPSTTTYAFTSGVLIMSTARKYQVSASQPGDYTIPPFDIRLKGGTTLRTPQLQLHVNASAAPAASQARTGPVVTPPSRPVDDTPSANTIPAAPPIPRDADGGPAKVFMILTPQTTEAYVGEMVPVRIDFYIRQEANADQDSLPTLKGSNFMMNDFTVRGHGSMTILENTAYACETFLSAFSAPKSGDFPLASERDTYWVKGVSQSGLDPFGFTKNTNLAHDMITSNQYIMHIHPLPEAGRPADFSGAVGLFVVAADAQPAVIPAGQPVTVTLDVRGVGNFDYVRCPVLPKDPHWKFYAPRSRISFIDEEQIQGVKTFELSAIPQKNGNVVLPRATFSFFDPRSRRYVTEPIDLPSIAVTGVMPPSVAAASATETTSTASPPSVADGFAPNRTELGGLQADMSPVYRAAWFWPVQAALVALPVLGLFIFLLRRRVGSRGSHVDSSRQTLRQAEQAMEDATRRGDARAFFLAARRAIQLRLGARWGVAPEAITLGEIRRRDPALAETVSGLFAQADEVLYSGRASAKLDLAHWQRVARECLHLQPA